MAYPDDRKYTKDHEWIRISGDTAEIGITDYAQRQLGDVVFVELPDVGATVNAGKPFGTIAGLACDGSRISRGRSATVSSGLFSRIIARSGVNFSFSPCR